VGSNHIALEIQLNSPQNLDGHGKNFDPLILLEETQREQLQMQSQCFVEPGARPMLIARPHCPRAATILS
jgi:hypothetical protein